MNDTNDRPDSQGPPSPEEQARIRASLPSWSAVNTALRRAKLPVALKAVLRAFNDIPPNGSRESFPSVGAVAREAGLSPGSVPRLIRQARVRGWLHLLPWQRETRGGKANVFAVVPVDDDLWTWEQLGALNEADRAREATRKQGQRAHRRQQKQGQRPMHTAGDNGGHVPCSESSMSHAQSTPIPSLGNPYAPQSPTVANRGDRASVVADADATKPPHPVTDGQGLLSHDSSAPVKCFPSRDSVALDATVSSEARAPLAAVLRTPPVTGAAEPESEAIEGGEGEPEGEPWAPRPGRVAGGGHAPPVVALDDDPLTGDPEQSAEGSEASTSSSLDATRHRDQPDAPQARTRTAAVPLDPDDDLSGSDHPREGYQWTDPDTAARVAWLDSEADAHAQGKRDEKNARDRETRARIAAEVMARPGGPAAVDQVAAKVTARPALAPHVSREWIAYALRDHPLNAPLGPRTLDAIGRALDARPVFGTGPAARVTGPAAQGAIASRVRAAVLEVLGLPADGQPTPTAAPLRRAKRATGRPPRPSTMKAKGNRNVGRASA